ncbi:MAG: SGNH/GDSL hydrolase family protein [Acidimicrobiia bacterium]
MSSRQSIKFVVKDAELLADVVLPRAEGGNHLEYGLKERLSALAEGIDFDVEVEEYSGLRSLLEDLASENPALATSAPDVVILSLAAEMDRLKEVGASETALAAVRADLVSAIRQIKEKVGAHILVTNVSTLDPANRVFTYHGVTEEPWTLRGHRLNLMLIDVSHEEGISIIDVDRKIAEVGGDSAVTAAARYGQPGCEGIVEEIVRIVDDYGFLDDRPLMEQVGAAAGRGS